MCPGDLFTKTELKARMYKEGLEERQIYQVGDGAVRQILEGYTGLRTHTKLAKGQNCHMICSKRPI